MKRYEAGNEKDKTGKKRRKISVRPYTREFFRHNHIRLILGILQMVFMAAATIGLSWLIQQIIDTVSGKSASSLITLLYFALGMIVLELAGAVLGYCSTPKFTARAAAQYKNRVFSELSKKSIAAFSTENTSRYISALSNDVNSIETGILTNAFNAANNVLMFVGALALMFYYSPLLAVISLGIAALLTLPSMLLGGKAAEAEKRISEANESYTESLKESLTGFAVVKAFRAEKEIIRLFAKKVEMTAKAKCKRSKLNAILQYVGMFGYEFTQLALFFIGAHLALSGKGVTPGMVIVFVQLLNYVLRPLMTMPQYFAQYKSAKALIVRTAESLSENIRDEGEVILPRLKTGISIKNLNFEYEEGKPVLNNLNFNFKAGKAYALVGTSGSGKSTLLNVLMGGGKYEGEVKYDEYELKNISGSSLYDLVSLIQQNVFVFNSSIRNNITMFRDFPKEAVDEAIKQAGLSELIAEKGENYLCGENGSGLSGGEKQRISIASSLLCKTHALFVDEATAALDAETAFKIVNSILDLDGTTLIVITHTLDEKLLRRYDGIIVLKNGNIIESGDFDTLMNKKGYFYSLYTVSQ